MLKDLYNIKLSELIIDRTNFKIPEKVTVVNARKSYEYVDAQKTSNIAYIKLECIDTELLKVLKAQGLTATGLKPLVIELHTSNPAIFQGVDEKQFMNRILSLSEAQLKLAWSSAQRTYNGLKLVIQFSNNIFIKE